MKQRYEIILAGSGGQGLVLSARLLGLAAILEGKNVAQTQSVLGDSQRGGLSAAEVLIDEEEIIFQQVEQPDIIVALGDMAIKKYAGANARIAMFYESGLADLGERPGLYAFPFAELAAKLGYAVNMIAHGRNDCADRTGVLRQHGESDRAEPFSETSAAKNLEAVRYGLELAKETPGKRVQAV